MISRACAFKSKRVVLVARNAALAEISAVAAAAKYGYAIEPCSGRPRPQDGSLGDGARARSSMHTLFSGRKNTISSTDICRFWFCNSNDVLARDRRDGRGLCRSTSRALTMGEASVQKSDIILATM